MRCSPRTLTTTTSIQQHPRRKRAMPSLRQQRVSRTTMRMSSQRQSRGNHSRPQQRARHPSLLALSEEVWQFAYPRPPADKAASRRMTVDPAHTTAIRTARATVGCKPDKALTRRVICAARRFKDVEEGLADVGSDSDEGAIVREATPEVELGPPLELSAPFVPRPATESLWLIRVRSWHFCLLTVCNVIIIGGLTESWSASTHAVTCNASARYGGPTTLLTLVCIRAIAVDDEVCLADRRCMPLSNVVVAYCMLCIVHGLCPNVPPLLCGDADVQHHAPGGAALRSGDVRQGGGDVRG